MNCEISESLKALAAEYERATTQKERDRLRREIARVSDKQERDRDGAHRRESRQGAFEASMLSLDNPSMRRTDGEDSPAWESDGGKGAAAIFAGMAEVAAQAFDPSLKKWMLNKLRRHPHLQKLLRRAIKDAVKGMPVRMKETHREKIREILSRQ